MSNKQKAPQKVGVIGSGLIGSSWAMLFAAAGYQVAIYDIKKSQLDQAMTVIQERLHDLEKQGLLRGKTSASEQFKLIVTTDDMAAAVENAFFIQECVPENEDLKRNVFLQLSELCSDDSTILSSSCSCILPSKIFRDIPRVAQCIIAHPCNPPYFCPLTEIIPHPKTNPAVTAKTRALMEEIGQSPVTVNKEIDGFCSNRMQYAIINEAWRLVSDGIMSVEDVDKIFTDGLGMRYAFIGPFETIHLNADGTENYMQKYSESIRRVSSSFGEIPTYDGENLKKINDVLSKSVAATAEELNEQRQWRDKRLIALSKLKRDLKK